MYVLLARLSHCDQEEVDGREPHGEVQYRMWGQDVIVVNLGNVQSQMSSYKGSS